jgi:hypothetical protein
MLSYLNPARALQDLRHFAARLKADTPKYWRVVQLRSAVIAGALEALIQSGRCPAHLLPYATNAAVACAVVVFFAQATKCDAPAAPASPSASQDSNDVTT